MSREEKYSAKLVIDTIIQRLGDALAAAVFQVLGAESQAGAEIESHALLPQDSRNHASSTR